MWLNSATMKVWTLHKTDQWHSNESKSLLGIFDSIPMLEEAMRKNGASKAQIGEVIDSGKDQNQGPNRDYEFEKETWEINEYTIV